MDNNIKVTHDVLSKRFFCLTGGYVSCVEYRNYKGIEGVIEIFHTLVPEELRGQGIASIIMNEVVRYVSENGLKVVPTCSYARKIFESDENRALLY